MTHAPPTPRTRARPRAGLGVAVLAGLIGLAGIAAGWDDRISSDPVEEFKKALDREKNSVSQPALDFREKKLNEAAKKLTTLDDISRALLLLWPEYNEEARKSDDKVRKDLLRRFVKVVREGFASESPARQAATALLVGETAASSLLDSRRLPGPSKDVKGTEKRDDLLRSRSQLDLTREIDALVPDLVKLASSPSATVRGAVARALGLIPRKPKEAAAGLDRILKSDPSSANRRAAATSLSLLVQSTTEAKLLPRSEPGIRKRETQVNKMPSADNDLVLAAVSPVAGRGLGDSDVTVRRQSASALEQVATALAREINLEYRFYVELSELPPRERKDRSPEERARTRRAREEIRAFEERIHPVIAGLTVARIDKRTVPDALVKAAADPDVEVRLGVRRTLSEMARVTRSLRDLRDLLPPPDAKEVEDSKKEAAFKSAMDEATRKFDGKNYADAIKAYDEALKQKPGDREALDGKNRAIEKKKEEDDRKKEGDKPRDGKKGDVSRSVRPGRLIAVSGTTPPEPFPILRLPPPPVPVRAAQDKDGEKIPLPRKVDDADRGGEKIPLPRGADDKDLLGKALLRIGEEIIRRGIMDPNPAGRRAALQAIESMEDLGKAFVPQLIEALKDRDRFVRWIAARTLGKLVGGERPGKLDPDSVSAVVAGLVCLLDEIDLDVRIAAIEALGLYGPAASRAVPALAARLGKGDAESRLAILDALEKIDRGSAAALPSIRPLLTAVDPRLRAEAARLIGKLGKPAREYLPDLRRLLRDPDVDVRKAAAAAILRLTDE